MAQHVVTIDQYNFIVKVNEIDCDGLCFSVVSGWFDMEDGTREDMGDELNYITNQLSDLIVGHLWQQLRAEACVL